MDYKVHKKDTASDGWSWAESTGLDLREEDAEYKRRDTGQPTQCHFNKADEHKVKSGLERKRQKKSRQGRHDASIIDAPEGGKKPQRNIKMVEMLRKKPPTDKTRNTVTWENPVMSEQSTEHVWRTHSLSVQNGVWLCPWGEGWASLSASVRLWSSNDRRSWSENTMELLKGNP